ncbi:MAG: adenosine kinase [Deltaproteobacteria bacterium]|nr:MAG: adenosine kinase [Deltaproteobacteria bacterium]
MQTYECGLVTGVGSALMDLLVHESDAYLNAVGIEKGGMTLMDIEAIDRALSFAADAPEMVPGGATCNTLVGVARLGGKSRFLGKCGDDAVGDAYIKSLTDCGMDVRLMRSATPTGRVLSVITPDAERSMWTCLAASSELGPADLSADDFSGTQYAVVEGYLLFNPDLMNAALKAAKAAGAKVVLDLASFTVVRECLDLLKTLIPAYVDILVANEDEVAEYTGETDPETALARLSDGVEIAVLKRGASGSLISDKGKVIRVPAETGAPIVDTTGAGDLWLGGFLYGLSAGYTILDAGKIGAACGYEVCRVVGAWIPDEGWARIQQTLSA